MHCTYAQHHRTEQGGGKDLDLVADLIRCRIQVCEGKVEQVVLHRVQEGRNAQLEDLLRRLHGVQAELVEEVRPGLECQHGQAYGQFHRLHHEDGRRCQVQVMVRFGIAIVLVPSRPRIPQKQHQSHHLRDQENERRVLDALRHLALLPPSPHSLPRGVDSRLAVAAAASLPGARRGSALHHRPRSLVRRSRNHPFLRVAVLGAYFQVAVVGLLHHRYDRFQLGVRGAVGHVGTARGSSGGSCGGGHPRMELWIATVGGYCELIELCPNSAGGI
mmetsp:Transcript_5029/g.14677  ORF Transcript_5029/g.14677 Transcript_5029/m.14677 type:complete len:274 (+) Transcript_5029:116-937(+)